MAAEEQDIPGERSTRLQAQQACLRGQKAVPAAAGTLRQQVRLLERPCQLLRAGLLGWALTQEFPLGLAGQEAQGSGWPLHWICTAAAGCSRHVPSSLCCLLLTPSLPVLIITLLIVRL